MHNMTTIEEVAFTSCLNDTVVSAYVWDARTGTNLMTYRGDCDVTCAGLSLISGEYVVAALQNKPFLRVWPINSQQPLSTLRLVCPGRVTLAQASPDNCYIAVTVAEKIHLYQVASGQQLGTGIRHFQPIRVVRWASDGSFVVCGGEDGLVTVWPLTALVLSQSSNPEPRYVMSDHALPITDLTITNGTRPRLFSVSSDRTCKIYDLLQGMLLVSLVFDKMLTAVTTSILETDVFVGTDSGTILQLGLLSPPRHLEYHVTAEESAPVFSGHTKAVQTLSVSLNGDLLMSGSADGSVKIWHITSHQCLRTLTHKGPVTNAFFVLKPKQIFDNELKPSVVIYPFHTGNSERSDCVDVVTQRSLTLSDNSVREVFATQATHSSDDKIKSLQKEIDLLRSINSNLYKFTVDKVISSSTNSSHVKDVALKPPEKQLKKRFKTESPVKQPKKKFKTSDKETAIKINGVPKNKKKRKKRNKKKAE